MTNENTLNEILYRLKKNYLSCKHVFSRIEKSLYLHPHCIIIT